MNKLYWLSTLSILFVVMGCGSKSEKNEDMNNNTLSNYVSYNLWANQQVVKWLQSVDESLLQKEVVSSFTTIRETLVHIWGAEYGWRHLLERKEWERPYDTEQFEGDLEEIFAGLLAASENLENAIQTALFSEVNLFLRGKDLSYTAEDITIHVCNHSTYHRGQIITMGRNVGLSSPPRTDYIFYAKKVLRNK